MPTGNTPQDPATAVSSRQPVCRIHATGFNAHNQLKLAKTTKSTPAGKAGQDLTTLIMIDSARLLPGSGEQTIDVLSIWSSTHLTMGANLINLGDGYDSEADGMSPAASPEPSRPDIRTTFGDHNGLLGSLDVDGRLYLATPNPSPSIPRTHLPPLKLISNTDSPRLYSITLAGNGKTAITFLQSPNAGLTHITTFSSFEVFANWYQDPAGEGSRPEDHFMIPGKTRSLSAGSGTFVLLMDDGRVFSWGDPRYRTLGRGIVGEGAEPAEKAAEVEALGGLGIVKARCQGWLCGALSRDGALYVWGMASLPGEQSGKAIKFLREAHGEVMLVEIAGENYGEPMDVVDFDIGVGHAVALTEGGRVFVVGENSNGQLGLGEGAPGFAEDWTELRDLPRGVTGVSCGPKASFLHGRTAAKETIGD